MADTHRILLVDDAAHVRTALRSLLESIENVEVVGEASDGREAALMAVRTRPTAVLLDLKMPVLEGLWALPLVKAAAPGARIVILSSYVSPAARRQALENGAAAVLEKGVDPDELLNTLFDLHPSTT